MVGFAFNTAFRTPVPVPTGTVKESTWGMFQTNQINRTLVLPVAGTSTALVTSSPKDLSLSVLTPGITSLSINPPQVNSLSVTPRVNSLSLSTHPTSLSLVHTPTLLAIPGPSRQSTASDGPQASSSKDMIIRAVTPTSPPEFQPESSAFAATRTEKRYRPDITSPNSISVRFANSLSEVIDVGAKIFGNTAKFENGVKDLVDAFDDLIASIQTQTQTVISQSKGKARAIGEEAVSRNDKARERAKELRKKGGEWIDSASVQFFERTEVAKQRAKGLKESFKQTEAWKSYEKVHADWVARLKSTEQCEKDKPGWLRKDVRDSWGIGLQRPTCVHGVRSPPIRGR